MGKRGPQPTPTKTLSARGSWRGKTRQDEPAPEPGRPICPKWLSPEGKTAWKYIAPQLSAMGILTKVDRNALARYCELWGRFEKASLWIQEHGEMYPVKEIDDDGNEVVTGFKQWAQVGIVNKLSERLMRLEAQFGLTPAARANMATPAPKNNGNSDSKTRFFQGAKRAG